MQDAFFKLKKPEFLTQVDALGPSAHTVFAPLVSWLTLYYSSVTWRVQGCQNSAHALRKLVAVREPQRAGRRECGLLHISPELLRVLEKFFLKVLSLAMREKRTLLNFLARFCPKVLYLYL